MLFNSAQFLVFFPVVLIVYYLIPNKIKYLWLLIASYYFYMCWNPKYALLLLSSTFVTYLSGLLMDRVARKDGCSDEAKLIRKKWIVAGSFIINLGILFFFKYFFFTFDLLQSVFALINVELTTPAFDIVLPVGISFYTFQALSYTMDVYRGEIYAEKNFFRYALFVSFFPQLVAGPIERSKNLLRQLAVVKPFSVERAWDGMFLMVWGFFLKLVIADRTAIVVNMVYGDMASYPGWYLIVATLLFGVQIYCDFSGYSIIAMGAARMLGIDLMENFKAPYLSTTVASFWRNWHISLTSWFKDYLYIPLGGSRKGKFRKYLNKMIVFLVSGLWHGAELSFVIWGGLNGLYQVVEELLDPLKKKLGSMSFFVKTKGIFTVIGCLWTCLLVNFSWIFFRASNIREAVEAVVSMAHASNGSILFDGSLYTCGLDQANFVFMILSIVVLLIADILKKKGVQIRLFLMQKTYWVKTAALILAVCFILVFGIWGAGYDASDFIYFQF